METNNPRTHIPHSLKWLLELQYRIRDHIELRSFKSVPETEILIQDAERGIHQLLRCMGHSEDMQRLAEADITVVAAAHYLHAMHVADSKEDVAWEELREALLVRQMTLDAYLISCFQEQVTMKENKA